MEPYNYRGSATQRSPSDQSIHYAPPGPQPLSYPQPAYQNHPASASPNRSQSPFRSQSPYQPAQNQYQNPFHHPQGPGYSPKVAQAPMAATQRHEPDLKIGRQRKPVLQMPHPEVPLSVQAQLMQQGAPSPVSQAHPPAPPAPQPRSASFGPDRIHRAMPKLPPIKIPAAETSSRFRTPTTPTLASPAFSPSMPRAPASASMASPRVHTPPVIPGATVSPPKGPAAATPTGTLASPATPSGSSATLPGSLGHRRFGSETRTGSPELSVDEFETVRRRAATQPHDPRAQLELARKLLEASDRLASRYTDPVHPSTMEVDSAQQQRNRDAWNMQAIKIAKQLASKTQFPDAMFLLGSIYSSRRYGVDVNYVKALEWYSKAARLDHPEAANRIAVCEEFGVGTQRNAEKAVSWYKRAAMLGSTGAMYKLGMLSMLGSLDQPRDFRAGLAWLGRAAERADTKTPHAVHELALLNEHSPLSTYIAGDPLPRSDSRALELFYTAARLGYAPAQSRLGRAFEFGELGCDVDPNYSISWYSQAAQQGDSNAELAMAGWYWTGAPQILKKNDTEAFLWAERSAHKGNTRALYCVGYFYETGTGVAADPRRAKKFYTLAADKQHPRAMQKLAEMF